MRQVDFLIVGAGPAGLGAALTAHGCGLSVLVVDEQPQAGGQIYRNLRGNSLSDPARILGADYLAGRPLLERFAGSGIDFLPRTRVWQMADGAGAGPTQPAYLVYLAGPPDAPPPAPVEARFVVLAAGAQERPFPLAGWTTPGVMTVGAAQILLKTAGLLPPDDTVLIGGGPLLYQFAWQVYRAGGRLQAIVDARGPREPARLLRGLPGALRAPALLGRGLKLLAALRRHGLRRIAGADAICLLGERRVDGVRFVADGREHRLETSSVLLHAGLIPDTRFSSALGVEHAWNPEQRAWQPRCDLWRESTCPGIFIVGDGARIAGAEAAQLSGRIAALQIARRAGRIDDRQRDAQAAPLFRQWRAKLAPRAFLDALYSPPPACFAPPDEAIVCRCENVSAGAIRAAARLGGAGPNQIKALTRAGMGACQGRQCACVAAALAAEAGGLDPAEAGMLRGRYPVKPVTLEEIALSHPAASETGSQSV